MRLIKKIVKYLFFLSIPSLLIFGARKFFKEETQMVTNKIQNQTCKMAAIKNFEKMFSDKRVAEKASDDYCNCVTETMSNAEIDIVGKMKLADIQDPEKALKKIQDIAVDAGIMQSAQGCMRDISQDYQQHLKRSQGRVTEIRTNDEIADDQDNSEEVVGQEKNSLYDVQKQLKQIDKNKKEQNKYLNELLEE